MKKINFTSLFLIGVILLIFSSCERYCVYCTTDGEDPLTDDDPYCGLSDNGADDYIYRMEVLGSGWECKKVAE